MFANIEYNNCSLCVKIKELSDKKGIFSVDTVDNHIKNIQYCLNDPSSKFVKLRYQSEFYNVIITRISWLADEYGCIFYECDFTVLSQNRNTLVWSTGGLHSDTLAGFDNIQELENKAIYLIENETDSVAGKLGCIIAGRKMSIIFNEIKLKSSLVAFLCKEAYARGFFIETTSNFSGGRSVVVGVHYNVRQIVEIMRSTKDADYFCYKKLCSLLGFDNVDVFARDFGFNGFVT